MVCGLGLWILPGSLSTPHRYLKGLRAPHVCAGREVGALEPRSEAWCSAPLSWVWVGHSGTVAAAVTELCVPAPTRVLERLGLVGQAAVITFSPVALVTLTPSGPPLLPVMSLSFLPVQRPLLLDAFISTLSCPPSWAFLGVTSLHLGVWQVWGKRGALTGPLPALAQPLCSPAPVSAWTPSPPSPQHQAWHLAEVQNWSGCCPEAHGQLQLGGSSERPLSPAGGLKVPHPLWVMWKMPAVAGARGQGCWELGPSFRGLGHP